ncbi:MAG: hypothetical protein ACTSU5_17665, partial [Promethearchaeota archaeon]
MSLAPLFTGKHVDYPTNVHEMNAVEFVEFCFRYNRGTETTEPFTPVPGYPYIYRGSMVSRFPKLSGIVLEDRVVLVDVDSLPQSFYVPPEVWACAFDGREVGHHVKYLWGRPRGVVERTLGLYSKQPGVIYDPDDQPEPLVVYVLASRRLGVVVACSGVGLLLAARGDCRFGELTAGDVAKSLEAATGVFHLWRDATSLLEKLNGGRTTFTDHADVLLSARRADVERYLAAVSTRGRIERVGVFMVARLVVGGRLVQVHGWPGGGPAGCVGKPFWWQVDVPGLLSDMGALWAWRCHYEGLLVQEWWEEDVRIRRPFPPLLGEPFTLNTEYNSLGYFTRPSLSWENYRPIWPSRPVEVGTPHLVDLHLQSDLAGTYEPRALSSPPPVAGEGGPGCDPRAREFAEFCASTLGTHPQLQWASGGFLLFRDDGSGGPDSGTVGLNALRDNPVDIIVLVMDDDTFSGGFGFNLQAWLDLFVPDRGHHLRLFVLHPGRLVREEDPACLREGLRSWAGGAVGELERLTKALLYCRDELLTNVELSLGDAVMSSPVSSARQTAMLRDSIIGAWAWDADMGRWVGANEGLPGGLEEFKQYVSSKLGLPGTFPHEELSELERELMLLQRERGSPGTLERVAGLLPPAPSGEPGGAPWDREDGGEEGLDAGSGHWPLDDWVLLDAGGPAGRLSTYRDPLGRIHAVPTPDGQVDPGEYEDEPEPGRFGAGGAETGRPARSRVQVVSPRDRNLWGPTERHHWDLAASNYIALNGWRAVEKNWPGFSAKFRGSIFRYLKSEVTPESVVRVAATYGKRALELEENPVFRHALQTFFEREEEARHAGYVLSTLRASELLTHLEKLDVTVGVVRLPTDPNNLSPVDRETREKSAAVWLRRLLVASPADWVTSPEENLDGEFWKALFAKYFSSGKWSFRAASELCLGTLIHVPKIADELLLVPGELRYLRFIDEGGATAVLSDTAARMYYQVSRLSPGSFKTAARKGKFAHARLAPPDRWGLLSPGQVEVLHSRKGFEKNPVGALDSASSGQFLFASHDVTRAALSASQADHLNDYDRCFFELPETIQNALRSPKILEWVAQTSAFREEEPWRDTLLSWSYRVFKVLEKVGKQCAGDNPPWPAVAPAGNPGDGDGDADQDGVFSRSAKLEAVAYSKKALGLAGHVNGPNLVVSTREKFAKSAVGRGKATCLEVAWELYQLLTAAAKHGLFVPLTPPDNPAEGLALDLVRYLSDASSSTGKMGSKSGVIASFGKRSGVTETDAKAAFQRARTREWIRYDASSRSWVTTNYGTSALDGRVELAAARKRVSEALGKRDGAIEAAGEAKLEGDKAGMEEAKKSKEEAEKELEEAVAAVAGHVAGVHSDKVRKVTSLAAANFLEFGSGITRATGMTNPKFVRNLGGEEAIKRLVARRIEEFLALARRWLRSRRPPALGSPEQAAKFLAKKASKFDWWLDDPTGAGTVSRLRELGFTGNGREYLKNMTNRRVYSLILKRIGAPLVEVRKHVAEMFDAFAGGNFHDEIGNFGMPNWLCRSRLDPVRVFCFHTELQYLLSLPSSRDSPPNVMQVPLVARDVAAILCASIDGEKTGILGALETISANKAKLLKPCGLPGKFFGVTTNLAKMAGGGDSGRAFGELLLNLVGHLLQLAAERRVEGEGTGADDDHGARVEATRELVAPHLASILHALVAWRFCLHFYRTSSLYIPAQYSDHIPPSMFEKDQNGELDTDAVLESLAGERAYAEVGSGSLGSEYSGSKVKARLVVPRSVLDIDQLDPRKLVRSITSKVARDAARRDPREFKRFVGFAVRRVTKRFLANVVSNAGRLARLQQHSVTSGKSSGLKIPLPIRAAGDYAAKSIEKKEQQCSAALLELGVLFAGNFVDLAHFTYAARVSSSASYKISKGAGVSGRATFRRNFIASLRNKADIPLAGDADEYEHKYASTAGAYCNRKRSRQRLVALSRAALEALGTGDPAVKSGLLGWVQSKGWFSFLASAAKFRIVDRFLRHDLLGIDLASVVGTLGRSRKFLDLLQKFEGSYPSLSRLLSSWAGEQNPVGGRELLLALLRATVLELERLMALELERNEGKVGGQFKLFRKLRDKGAKLALALEYRLRVRVLDASGRETLEPNLDYSLGGAVGTLPLDFLFAAPCLPTTQFSGPFEAPVLNFLFDPDYIRDNGHAIPDGWVEREAAVNPNFSKLTRRLDDILSRLTETSGTFALLLEHPTGSGVGANAGPKAREFVDRVTTAWGERVAALEAFAKADEPTRLSKWEVSGGLLKSKGGVVAESPFSPILGGTSLDELFRPPAPAELPSRLKTSPLPLFLSMRVASIGKIERFSTISRRIRSDWTEAREKIDPLVKGGRYSPPPAPQRAFPRLAPWRPLKGGKAASLGDLTALDRAARAIHFTLDPGLANRAAYQDLFSPDAGWPGSGSALHEELDWTIHDPVARRTGTSLQTLNARALTLMREIGTKGSGGADSSGLVKQLEEALARYSRFVQLKARLEKVARAEKRLERALAGWARAGDSRPLEDRLADTAGTGGRRSLASNLYYDDTTVWSDYSKAALRDFSAHPGDVKGFVYLQLGLLTGAPPSPHSKPAGDGGQGGEGSLARELVGYFGKYYSNSGVWSWNLPAEAAELLSKVADYLAGSPASAGDGEGWAGSSEEAPVEDAAKLRAVLLEAARAESDLLGKKTGMLKGAIGRAWRDLNYIRSVAKDLRKRTKKGTVASKATRATRRALFRAALEQVRRGGEFEKFRRYLTTAPGDRGDLPDLTVEVVLPRGIADRVCAGASVASLQVLPPAYPSRHVRVNVAVRGTDAQVHPPPAVLRELEARGAISDRVAGSMGFDVNSTDSLRTFVPAYLDPRGEPVALSQYLTGRVDAPALSDEAWAKLLGVYDYRRKRLNRFSRADADGRVTVVESGKKRLARLKSSVLNTRALGRPADVGASGSAWKWTRDEERKGYGFPWKTATIHDQLGAGGKWGAVKRRHLFRHASAVSSAIDRLGNSDPRARLRLAYEYRFSNSRATSTRDELLHYWKRVIAFCAAAGESRGERPAKLRHESVRFTGRGMSGPVGRVVQSMYTDLRAEVLEPISVWFSALGKVSPELEAVSASGTSANLFVKRGSGGPVGPTLTVWGLRTPDWGRVPSATGRLEGEGKLTRTEAW